MARGDERRTLILSILTEPKSAGQIQKELDLPSAGAVAACLTDLQAKGMVKQVSSGRPALFQRTDSGNVPEMKKVSKPAAEVKGQAPEVRGQTSPDNKQAHAPSVSVDKPEPIPVRGKSPCGFCSTGHHPLCPGTIRNGANAPNPLILCPCAEDGHPESMEARSQSK